MPEPTDNRAPYDLGRRYARRVDRRLPAAWDERSAIGEVAAEAGEGVKEVRTAVDFARHVDAIAKEVRGARPVILDRGHPHLTPAIVRRIAGRSPTRIRAALARAAAGLYPFAPPPPTDLPAEHAIWHYDLDRLGRAHSLLKPVAQAGRTTSRLPTADLADLAVHTTAVLAILDALRPVLGGTPREPSVAPPRAPAGGNSAVVRQVARARALVEAATGDLLRAAHTRSVEPARKKLAAAVRDVADAATAVRARYPAAVEPVDAPGIEHGPDGPSADGGTYVVVFHAGTARLVRIARLGTFRLPAGHLLYVGSAFQAGGVGGRTRRHLAGSGSRLWGVDDLRGFATPVALWWTHHTGRVEHVWARALAGMPAYTCPAPHAGASDCNRSRDTTGTVGEVQRCPAHLFHAVTAPAVDQFARQLGLSGSGGYTIRHQDV